MPGLHIDFRPTDFNGIIGNDAIIASLESIFKREQKRYPHVFLFYGPSGCGKTTLGRIIAEKYLDCNMELNYLEVNAANNRGIDTARKLIENLDFAAMGGGNRVILIDECHQITKDFANAMLKPLEDTPEHVYFILCTTQPDDLIPTIMKRCSKFKVEKLDDDQIYNLVDSVLAELDIPSLPDHVADKLIESVDGCAREALIVLDQIIDLDNDKSQLDAIEAYTGTDEKQAKDLFNALLAKKSWKVVSGILNKVDGDPEKIRRSILGLAAYNLLKGNDAAAFVIECFKDPYFNTGKPGLVLSCYETVIA